jgi:hypothetical protein
MDIGTITLKIQQEIDLLQNSIPEITDQIESVLNEWDYSVVNKTGYKFTFKRSPGYMPRQEAVLYTHYGEIELVESEKSGILEMKYTVDYILHGIFVLWIVFIGATTDTRAYWFVAVVVLYFFYRLYKIRKNCREMLLQIADGQ